MEVRIGIQHAPRELIIEVPESGEEVSDKVQAAVQGGGTLTLTDSKGRQVLVPASQIAFVEIGTGVVGTVGFR